jgi:alanyl-tRNA synthetase
MDSNSLRRAYLDFFVAQGHLELPSSGLIPHHPRAPLFTNAGMNQFIPYFLGEEIPTHRRATTAQKCVRVRGRHDDIDLVGRTTRHLTFFEMLGNFSFGDYFKTEAIHWAWELLVDKLGMEADRIWVTVYTDDDQAADIWANEVGVPRSRIQRMGEDNFWEMGETGPCGPCSELYYDRGPDWGAEGGPVGGGEERYVEFWNLVFPQYDRQKDGELAPLPRPGIDTGAGLERLLTIFQGVRSIWETDVLRPLIARAEAITGRTYGDDPETDVALRILADHARSMSFLIADDVVPSNDDRGYVLRRLIRRAVLRLYLLGVDRVAGPDLVEATVEVMGGAYPDLARKQALVAETVAREEAQFRSTLRAGMAMLESELAGGRRISGEAAFRLHDTHGFPIELTREIAVSREATVDEPGFEAAMKRQRQQSKAGIKRLGAGETNAAHYRDLLESHGPTRFVGYEGTSARAQVLAVLPTSGEQVEVFLDVTPFYAEGGGQVGDTGTISTSSGQARVVDTTAALPGLHRHLAVIEEGSIEVGQEAQAEVDADRRAAIRRNHTGTHLLHWALRQVLGSHVKQQGSLVAPDRLRFDFTHFKPLSREEIDAVEDLANAEVLSDAYVTVEHMDRHSADQAGAMAFFEERYGDVVRVVRAGSASVELCGGTHVDRLGMIGPIEIVTEQSIGSNLRRVEALTGTATLERLRANEARLSQVASLLKATPDEILPAIERRLADLRAADDRLRSLQQAALAGEARQLAAEAIAGAVVARRDGLTAEALRDLALAVRSEPGVEVVVLGGAPEVGKVSLVAAARSGGRFKAPELIVDAARAVGGGGGGKNPELAMAGGRDASRLDEALEGVRMKLKDAAA